LKIPFNLLLEKGEIKMKIFLIFPRPLMGEGEGERVKECKRRLESNHPLSLTLSHAGAVHYPQVIYFFLLK
jgi:hypothetical protein